MLPLLTDITTENKWCWDTYLADYHIYKYRQEIPKTRPPSIRCDVSRLALSYLGNRYRKQ